MTNMKNPNVMRKMNPKQMVWDFPWGCEVKQKTDKGNRIVMSIRFFDMFAGIGSFRSGLEAVGGFTKWRATQ